MEKQYDGLGKIRKVIKKCLQKYEKQMQLLNTQHKCDDFYTLDQRFPTGVSRCTGARFGKSKGVTSLHPR